MRPLQKCFARMNERFFRRKFFRLSEASSKRACRGRGRTLGKKDPFRRGNDFCNGLKTKHLIVPLILATTSLSPEVKEVRKTEYPADPLFVNRWSPRSMSGKPISKEELLTLIEAARWAPSSFNEQPWRFIYIKNKTPEWDQLYATLVPFNQNWAKKASYLVFIVSHDTFTQSGKESRTAAFDTGAAWMAFALQGSLKGYVVHGMSGFDYQKARTLLKVPKGYTIQAVAAVGRRAPRKALPKELRASEVPSDRKTVSEIAYEGTFGG